jgi:hypothetical protein
MTGDIRDEWRLADIERKAERALDGLSRLETVQHSLYGLENDCRHLRELNVDLRSEVCSLRDKVERLEQIVTSIQEDNGHN